MRVLVLGARGFLGSHLCRAIESAPPSPRWEILRERDRAGERAFGDLTDADALQRVLLETAPDLVVNFVAAADGTPELLHRVNADLPRRLMEMVATRSELARTRVTLIGSAAEYGDNGCEIQQESSPLVPVSEYGRSKVAQFRHFAEATDAGVDAVLVRPFNVVAAYMPPRLSLRTFLDRIRALPDGGALATGNLSATRDFLDIDDLVRALVAAVTAGTSGEVYNVCSGVGVTMRLVVDEMVRASGKSLSVDEDARADPGVAISVGSHDKLTSATGWVPTVPLVDSLAKMFRSE